MAAGRLKIGLIRSERRVDLFNLSDELSIVAQFGPRHHALAKDPDFLNLAGAVAANENERRELLAEASGFKSFAKARAAVKAAIARAVPLVWGLLDNRGLAGPTLKFQLPEELPNRQFAALYDYRDHTIRFNLDYLTDWSLLANHPFPDGVDAGLLSALDPCLFFFMYKSVSSSYFTMPLQGIIHELIHAEHPTRLEPYISTPFDEPLRRLVPEGYQLTGVLTGAAERYVLTNSRGEKTFLMLKTDELAEGVVDRVSHWRALRFASVINEPLLTTRPAWPIEIFEQAPWLLTPAYWSEAITLPLSEGQLLPYLDPGCEIIDLLAALADRLSRPQQIALVKWLHNRPPGNRPGREVEQSGYRAIARWLGYPAAQSAVSRRRRRSQEQVRRTYEAWFPAIASE